MKSAKKIENDLKPVTWCPHELEFLSIIVNGFGVSTSMLETVETDLRLLTCDCRTSYQFKVIFDFYGT